ncbi:RING-type domain-containing protein [Caenorhabditis elegans]|uniref:RING-type domain-containing protein n=1 Tax=Caenorhabditis elegans TaxID=6239 RepID=Q95X87_CAEEL|nr:RING-type domain-containing protein [Caenorhabditis elegans]CCD61649.1 RING-type domain-containing protein [Caenorhabditis elegans]|eukprot:NP_494238.2 Uncharacterized protein CELE_ZK1240.9 [Caenorhabditis elegans]
MSFLQCEVCNEDYSDIDEDHIPKVLKCGHSVCQNCATQLITALLIICPFCRETTEISDGDDQKLQKNFALVQAIQVMKADSPPKCEEHPYNLAEFVCVKPRCSSSNKLMCKTCEEFGVHRNHKKSLLLTEASSLRESLGFRIEKRETQIEKLQEDINTINLAQLGNMEDGDEFKEKAKKITSHYANLNLRLYEEKAQALAKLKTIAQKIEKPTKKH